MTDPVDEIVPFLWEPRYLVLKLSDLRNLTPAQWRQLDEIVKVHAANREALGKPVFDAIVVETDWPEYEALCDAIEARAIKEKNNECN